MPGIDLHMHTLHSDGELRPAEIVERAKALDIEAIAITDHDSTDGVREALEAGMQFGLEVIPGVELSVQHEEYEQVHLLGYYVDRSDPDLELNLTELRDSRLGRGKRLVERINERLTEEGKPLIDFLAVEMFARKVVGRPHIARVMTEMGITATMMDAFRDYLVPLNIHKHKLSFEKAVDVVRRSGGVTVLAHPNLITRDRQEEVRLLDEFTRMGLDGLEVYYNNMTAQDTEHYRVLALERDLLITGGSDFHGFNSYGNMGRVYGDRLVPEELLEPLQERFFANRLTLVGVCHRDPSLRRDLAGRLASLVKAEILDANQILRTSFPDLSSREPLAKEVCHAVARILLLEAELRLMRGQSVVVQAPALGADSLAGLQDTARRTRAQAAFLVDRESARTTPPIEAPVIAAQEEDGAVSLTAPSHVDSLGTLLYFHLDGGKGRVIPPGV